MDLAAGKLARTAAEPINPVERSRDLRV